MWQQQPVGKQRVDTQTDKQTHIQKQTMFMTILCAHPRGKVINKIWQQQTFDEQHVQYTYL